MKRHFVTAFVSLVLAVIAGPSVDPVYAQDTADPPPFFNGAIKAMLAPADGRIFVGGVFTEIDGAPMERLAVWDGETWSEVGGGINGDVETLGMDGDGRLYAGGNFTLAGGVAVNNIAVWDGSEWSDLGGGVSGPDSYVTTLAFGPLKRLYVGGAFTAAGGVEAANVARWNGTSWSPLGDGLEGTEAFVETMTFSGSILYAGGRFEHSGETTTNNIAAWDGASWNALEAGLRGDELAVVEALVAGSDGTLYAGGAFSQAGFIDAVNVAQWNGTGWSAVGSGLPGFSVASFAVGSDDQLYAGGRFVGGSVAVWDGETWQTVGGGISGIVFAQVNALVQRNGEIFVGGLFDRAGDVDVSNLAVWLGDEWAPVGGSEAPSDPAPTFDAGGSTPPDDATGVAVDANLALEFSETVILVTGDVALVETDVGPVETFDVETGTGDDGGTVTADGSTVTLSPGSTLEPATAYHVTIAATAIVDEAGNPFAGMTNETDYDFETENVVAPPFDGRLLSSSGVAFGGIIAFNPDVEADDLHLFHLTENTFDRTVRWPGNVDGRSKSSHPSASEAGRIAFMSNRGGLGFRIHVMESDGTGQRALTTAEGVVSPTEQDDEYPAISPDGSRVAFISTREEMDHPNGFTWRPSGIFIVHADGTGLRRLTSPQANTGSGPAGSHYYSVDWNPDGTLLAYLALRHVEVDGNFQWRRVLGTIEPDGSNESVLLQVPDCGNGRVLDWSPDGRHILLSFGGAVQGCFAPHYFIYDRETGGSTTITNEQLGGSVCNGEGCARFSPDGTTIGFGGEDGRIRFIRSDGTNLRTREVPIARGEPLWWMAGPSIGRPASLSMETDTIHIANGESIQLSPVLRDAGGNVLSRMVSTWTHEGRLDTPVSITAELLGIEEDQQGTLCAHNAGRADCVIVVNEMQSSVAVENPPAVPARFALHTNYPNPFNPQTTISFDLPQSRHVTLTVYDLTGREVARLLDEPLPSGTHAATWDAAAFASGVYLARLQAGSFIETRAMTLLK